MRTLTLAALLLTIHPPSYSQAPNSEAPYTVVDGTLLLKDPFGGHFEKLVHPRFAAKQPLPPEEGDNKSTKIKVPRFRGSDQGNAPWCWACCVSMILYHQGIEKSACQVVSDTLRKNCCSLFAPPSCWTPGNLQAALLRYHIPTQTQFHYGQNLRRAAVELVRELRKGNPIALILQQKPPLKPGQTGSHSTVIYGVEGLYQPHPHKLKFIMYDPVIGPTKVTAKELLYYSNGPQNPRYRWVASVKVLNKTSPAR